MVYQDSAGVLRIRQRHQCRIYGENTMHTTSQAEKTRATVQSRPTRPNSAPAYYLARPASFWIAVTTRRAGTPDAGR
jgi:hypothetical protein